MNFHLFINEIYYLFLILLITFILSLIFIANVEKFIKYELFTYLLIFLGFFSGNLLFIFHTIFFINSGIIFNLDFIFFLLFTGSILWINYVTYKIILKKIILGLIYLPLVIVFVILQVTLKSENIYKVSKYCKPIQDKKTQCIYDEDKYVGDLKSFRRHGEGTYFWKSGNTYTGKWVEDKREGYGIEKFPGGARYTGEFKNSLFNGSGVYIYPDGGKHEGKWKNGKKEGKGISTLANGNRIEGEFKDGKLLTKEKIKN
jgi:hypothetical protein